MLSLLASSTAFSPINDTSAQKDKLSSLSRRYNIRLFFCFAKRRRAKKSGIKSSSRD